MNKYLLSLFVTMAALSVATLVLPTNTKAQVQPSVTVTNQSATIVGNNNGINPPTSATVTFQFTFSNTSDDSDLYISSNPNIALATTPSSSNNPSPVLSFGLVKTTPSTVAGDLKTNSNDGYYVIPTKTSRTFSYTGTLDNKNGAAGLQSASIASIYYGSKPDVSYRQQYNVTNGLEKLKTPKLNMYNVSFIINKPVTGDKWEKGQTYDVSWVSGDVIPNDAVVMLSLYTPGYYDGEYILGSQRQHLINSFSTKSCMSSDADGNGNNTPCINVKTNSAKVTIPRYIRAGEYDLVIWCRETNGYLCDIGDQGNLYKRISITEPNNSPQLFVKQLQINKQPVIGEKQATLASFDFDATKSTTDVETYILNLRSSLGSSYYNNESATVYVQDDLRYLSNCNLYSGSKIIAPSRNGSGNPSNTEVFYPDLGTSAYGGLYIKKGTHLTVDFRCDVSNNMPAIKGYYTYYWTISDTEYPEFYSIVSGQQYYVGISGGEFSRNIPFVKISTPLTVDTKTILSVSANPKEIPNGATTTLFMTAHSNASSTELMAVCPQGVRADWLQSTESNKNICNVSKQLNPRSLPPMTLQVFNGNPTTKEISVNFYERFPGNAYAFGSSTRIIVRGLASTTPQCLKLTTNLDEGSTGGEVVALQELLIKLGFLSKDLTQKGYYGPSTTAAVKGFQNSVNITATGSVGPLTREALNNKSCNGVIEDNRPITENAKSGSLAFRLDSANPSSRVVNISSTQNTSDVVLAIFDIKSEGVSSVLNSLKLNVNAISPNWKGSNVNKLFDRVYVKIGDKSYQYDSVEPIVKTEKGQKLVFSNMAAPLPANAWVPVTIYGVVAKNTNNALNKSSAEVVLYASDANVSAVDGKFNNMKVVLKPVLYSGVATFAGSVVSGGVSVSNVNTSFGDPVISNNTVVAYPFSMTFTVNNNGDKDIFMSKKHVGNEIVAVISPNTATVSFADNSYTPATIAGDSANYVIIPSNTSRVVKYNGVLMNSGIAGYVSYRVTSIFYGNTADVTNNMSIKSGLEGLYIYAMFGGKGAAKDVNAVDTKTVNTTITPTPTYSSTPTSTYTPAPVVTSTPVPTTYVAPASTPTTTTSPTPTTTASPTTTSSPSYNYPTPTYTTSPTSTARPTSSPVSNIFGEYQTASVWSLMLKFLRFTF